jgi:hypothetical protein
MPEPTGATQRASVMVTGSLKSTTFRRSAVIDIWAIAVSIWCACSDGIRLSKSMFTQTQGRWIRAQTALAISTSMPFSEPSASLY